MSTKAIEDGGRGPKELKGNFAFFVTPPSEPVDMMPQAVRPAPKSAAASLLNLK